MNQNPKAPFKQIGLFRIRGEAHRDLILAQCSSWFFVADRQTPTRNMSR